MEFTTRYEMYLSSNLISEKGRYSRAFSSPNSNIHPFPGLTSFTKCLLTSVTHREQRPLFTALTLTYSKLAHPVQKARDEIYVVLKFSLEEKWKKMKGKNKKKD